MDSNLEKELDFFLSMESELVEKYRGKFVVIQNEAFIGAYDTEQEAYDDARKHFELGTFLIRKCLAESEKHTQTFQSRAYLP